MNSLSTKIYSFDPSFFIENYLDKRLWKKEWPIFEYDGFVFTVLLSTIWTYDMSLSLRVTLKKNEFTTSSTFFVYLENKDNDILINRRLVNTVISLIENYESSLIKESHNYLQAVELEEKFNKKLKRTARAYMRDNNITNRKIVKYYVEGFVRENTKNFAFKVVQSNMHKVIPHLYIAWLSFVGDEDKLNKFLAEQPRYDATEIIKEIENFKDFLESNNLIGELKKILPNLKEEE